MQIHPIFMLIIIRDHQIWADLFINLKQTTFYINLLHGHIYKSILLPQAPTPSTKNLRNEENSDPKLFEEMQPKCNRKILR